MFRTSHSCYNIYLLRIQNKEKHRRNSIRPIRLKANNIKTSAAIWCLQEQLVQTENGIKSVLLNLTKKKKSDFINPINSFKTKDEQDIFLEQFVENHGIQHRKRHTETPKTRSEAFKYFMLRVGERINVCKQ